MPMLSKALISLLLVLGSSAAAASTDTPGGEGVKCALSVETATVGALEPVWLDISCENPQTTTFTMLLGPGAFGLRIAPPAAGKACWSIISADPLRGVEFSMSEIPPHEKASVRVLLNRWFRLSKVGRYTVTLIDCRNSRAGEDPGGSALTSEVAFEILPLDEKRLAAVCSQLAQVALSGKDDAAKEAAITLSWIDSPVAVPYLKKVLEANVFESFFVVAGLAQINTPEAVAILIEDFDKVSGFTRMKIKDYLSQMKPQVADPTLRHRLDLIWAWQPKIVE